MRPTSRSRTVRVLAIAAPVAALSLAGCGGGGDNGSATATNASASGGDVNAFRDCMKQHGVDLPDNIGLGDGQGQPPTGGQPPGDVSGDGQPFGNDPKLQKAFEACRDKAPAGGFGGARNSQAFQAYTSCLRDHGVDVPDPSTSTSTSTGQSSPPPTFDRNDPKVAAANEACKALLPTPTTTTSTTVKS